MAGHTSQPSSRLTRRQRTALSLVAVVCILLVPIGLTAAQSVSYEESWNESGTLVSNAIVYENDLIVYEDGSFDKYDRSGTLLDSVSVSGVDGGDGAEIDREEGIIYVSDTDGSGISQFTAIDADSMTVVDTSPTVDATQDIHDIAFDAERNMLYFATGDIGRWDVDSGSIQTDGSVYVTSVAVDESDGTVYGYGRDYASYDASFSQIAFSNDEFDGELYDAEFMHDRRRVLAVGDLGANDVYSINPDDVSDRPSLFSGVTAATGAWDVINYRENTSIVAWGDSNGDIGYYDFDSGNSTTIDSGTAYDQSLATWDWNSIGIAYTGDGIGAYELNASGVAPPGDLDFDVNTFMRPGTSQTYSVEFSLETEDTYSDVTENATVTSSDNDTLTVYPSNNTLVATGNTSKLPATVTVTAEYDNRTTTKDVTIAEPSIENLDQLPTWWKVNATVGDGMMLWLIVATLAAVVATRAATSFAGVGAYVMFMIAGWMTGSVSDGVVIAAILTGLFLGLNLAANVDTTIRGSG